MIKFKFYQVGLDLTDRRHMLPNSKSLPGTFTLDDVKSGMFNVSVMKRLHSAKKDGSKIILKKSTKLHMRGLGYEFGLRVINVEDRKRKQKKIKSIESKLKKLNNTQDVQDFFSQIQKLLALNPDNKFVINLLSTNVGQNLRTH